MDLQERSYSTLIVSASSKFNQALPEIFPVTSFFPINKVSDISTAKRAVAAREFDIVVVNSPLPDDAGIRFAIDTVDSGSTVVLFIAGAETFDDVNDRLTRSGVFVMRRPASINLFLAAASWLVSARERLRKTEKKTLSIEEKMNEIRLVNRAKWLLISELKMTEPDAHRYIEKQAMDRCVSKRIVSEEIIKTYG